MAQPLVLAIEPDLRQAAIVKRIVREKVLADVAVVDSRDAAIEAMRTSMPDVLLLSALLSPRDEDELIAHLKTLDNAGHLQTHTIPQLASALGPGEEPVSRGLLSAFRRKKGPASIASGCDPDLFAEEIRVFLQRAEDQKRDLQEMARVSPAVRPVVVTQTRAADEPVADPSASPASSWESPFEWKPAGASSAPSRSVLTTTPVAEAGQHVSLVSDSAVARSFLPDEPPQPPSAAAAPVDTAPVILEPLIPEPLIEAPRMPAAAIAQPAAPEPAASVVLPPEPEIVLAAPVVEPTPVAPAAPVAGSTAPAGARLKPMAERATKIAARLQLRELTKAAKAAKRREDEEYLGLLARWARIESPSATRATSVTADDVRMLMASLAVPQAVASVRYARGCRIRRVRVPAAPDLDSSDVGPVILSRRTLAEQREKHATA